jgi:hypothetical protein
MSLGLNLSQRISIEQRLSLPCVQMWAKPLSDLDLTIKKIVENPEEAARIINRKREGESDYRGKYPNPFYAIEEILSGVRREKHQPSKANVPLISNMEAIQIPETSMLPDITYHPTGHYNFTITHEPHFLEEPKLRLLQIPREVNNLIGFLIKQKNFMVKTTNAAYNLMGKTQSKFLYTLKPEDLIPFISARLAEEIGYHHSTLWRLLHNRTVRVQHEQGIKIIPVEYLLPHKDLVVMYNSITHINDLFEEEFSAGKAISDEKILEKLKGKSSDIARRTLTKYRQITGVPNNNVRNQEYAARGREKPYKIEPPIFACNSRRDEG